MKRIRGLYHRWARSGPVRASGNPLIRLAARRGLPAADDLVTADAQIAVLAPHFDTAFYASWYGIAADPVRDYLVHGWRAGRDPRPDFDSAAYLAAHPHLARAGINPLLHALARRRAGREGEGEAAALPKPDTAEAHRLARRLVDGAFYLAGNPDLAAAGVDPVDHYMASGWREGREPAPQFDTLAYCLTRGITFATQNPLVHYVLHGGPARPDPDAALALRIETLAPYFDAAHYRQRLPEPQAEALAGASDAALLRHYVAEGWRARIGPRPDFDPAGYVQARSGSRAVSDDPFFRYVAETRLSGGEPFAEPHRLNLPAVDADWYRATYPDVGGREPFLHFAEAGWRELRDPGPGRSTLAALLRVCGLRPARAPVEDTAWLGAIGQGALDRDALLDLQARLVAGHFDHGFYRARYRLSEAEDAVRDYCDTGWKKGRNPRPDFNGWAYRAHHPSAEATGLAPFVHHLARALLRGDDLAGEAFDPRYGAPPAEEDAELFEQARLIEPFFDAPWYVKRYPDTRGFENGPVIHFLSHGQEEDRDPNKTFSTRFYRRAYGHLLGPGESPFLHYVRTGRAAGLMGCPEDLGTYPPMEAPAAHAWDRLPRALPIAQARVVVIVPVYKGRGETLRAIHACLSAPQATPFTLLAVNDRSPDPELTAELAALAGRGLFHLVENEQNLGFVRSVNRALGLRQGRAVVLLNSDAEVFGDWLDRLVAHAEPQTDPQADPRAGSGTEAGAGAGAEAGRGAGLPVGSVTPLSNNATICSYPRFNANNTMPLEIARPDLDRVAAQVNRGRAVPVPTGVGFCMYMTAAALDAVGDLDAEAFGKGYGEENDWCLRATKAGFVNLLAEDVFVHHAGQISFGLDEGGEYVQGQAALLAKHPDYPARVGQFVQADPGRRGRARLDRARLARHFSGRALLYVTHSWGGGIQRHIDDMVAQARAEGLSVVLLQIDRTRNLEVHVSYRGPEFLYLPNLDSLYLPRDAAELADFVGQLAPVLIHVHSLAGLRWGAAQALMEVVAGAGRPYAWTLHDYSPVCHRNHLVQPDGRYCGLAPVNECRSCLAVEADGFEEPDPGERRAAFGAFLAGAARVFAPSCDTAARIRAVYPDLAVTVRPHVEPERSVRSTALQRPGRVRRVAVLGAISVAEGGLLLQALATDARKRDLPLHFTIVGYSDPALTGGLERAGVIETGRYSTDDPTLDRVARAALQIAEAGRNWEDDETLDLVTQVSPDLVLLPSIWPETYSYTLSLALRTGLPVVAFKLGEPSERLKAYPNGHLHLLPYVIAANPAAFNDQMLAINLSANCRISGSIHASKYNNMLHEYYSLKY
ncbi:MULTISPECIES: glycosyltransferase [Methylobacterium]|uniref:GT2 family glycosyltransferase/glycosyltransferase involved in cell wall biosynthesis n=1 Tax=Methylobacterium radiotolerans TaxID=31998 RepID=A0ABV2N981_9HYPH|nr:MULTISPECIES: glycosyltransferase [unclassified Methylobacterium]MBP2493705.1 GT2 family glycosyltransferase/glycosyltransferase involved in cell wall biosynthesis [Methylobacterium sp. PvP105]MBP2499922.1 GT2 family glycosyltransferase/glycosyltransferase involved in cell wall biosynthesis [Methylobacterium sp. PvP109]